MVIIILPIDFMRGHLNVILEFIMIIISIEDIQFAVGSWSKGKKCADFFLAI